MPHSKRVLAIGLDEEMATRISSQLSGQGVEFAYCDNGRNAPLQAKAERPDAILLRIELPDMSGYSVCNKIKKDPDLSRIPLTIISSDATPETFAQHAKLKTRAEEYLLLPSEPGRIEGTLLSQLGIAAPATDASAGASHEDVLVELDDTFADDSGGGEVAALIPAVHDEAPGATAIAEIIPEEAVGDFNAGFEAPAVPVDEVDQALSIFNDDAAPMAAPPAVAAPPAKAAAPVAAARAPEPEYEDLNFGDEPLAPPPDSKSYVALYGGGAAPANSAPAAAPASMARPVAPAGARASDSSPGIASVRPGSANLSTPGLSTPGMSDDARVRRSEQEAEKYRQRAEKLAADLKAERDAHSRTLAAHEETQRALDDAQLRLGDLDDLQVRFQMLQEQFTQLQAEAENLRGAAAQAAEAQAQVGNLTAQYNELHAALESANQALQNKEHEVAHLQEQVQQLETRKMQAYRRIKDDSNRIEAIRHALESAMELLQREPSPEDQPLRTQSDA